MNLHHIWSSSTRRRLFYVTCIPHSCCWHWSLISCQAIHRILHAVGSSLSYCVKVYTEHYLHSRSLLPYEQATELLWCQAKQEQEQAQIEALEMKLLVPDILLFRHLASRALKRRPSQQGSHTPLLSENSSAAASKDSSVQVLLEAAKELGSPKEAGFPKEGQSKEADSPPESSSR